MRLLSAADVRQAAPMPDMVSAIREGFISLSTGQATVPMRGVLEVPEGFTLTMPASDRRHISVKVVTLYPGNPALGIPLTQAMLLLVEAETGTPLALMDARVLTGLRTGAGSAVATDLMARPDAWRLAMVGAGAMARYQIEAIRAVRDISEIHICSQSGAEELAQEVGGRAFPTVEEACRGAHIIVCATSSPTPVLHLKDVPKGCHINGIGSFTPEMAELAPDLIRAARIVVDHRESAWSEAGDLLQADIPHSHADTELGEVAAGLKPGRTSPDEITFFKSVGNAIQDLAAARLVYERATELGLGTEFSFD